MVDRDIPAPFSQFESLDPSLWVREPETSQIFADIS
jgi:hypothetical protein